MATVAVLNFPVTAIGLEQTFHEVPGCLCRIEESAFNNLTSATHLWISGPSCHRVQEALQADTSVHEWTLINEEEGEWLFAVKFDEDGRLPQEIIQDRGGTVLEAIGGPDGWTLKVRFPNRAALADAADEFDRLECEATYESIRDRQEFDTARITALSDAQREAVEAALERGYFKIPRETSLKELATHLGVSHQSLSERLRRAFEILAYDSLVTTQAMINTDSDSQPEEVA